MGASAAVKLRHEESPIACRNTAAARSAEAHHPLREREHYAATPRMVYSQRAPWSNVVMVSSVHALLAVWIAVSLPAVARKLVGSANVRPPVAS